MLDKMSLKSELKFNMCLQRSLFKAFIIKKKLFRHAHNSIK